MTSAGSQQSSASSRKGAFHPPTPEQLRHHLESHPPRGPARWVAWLMLILLGAMVALAMVVHSAWGLLLPLVFLALLLLGLSVRSRMTQQVDRQVTRVQELAMQRYWPQSLRLAWRLLPRLVAHPLLHGRTVAIMAHNLDQLHCYEAAMVAYDYLIDNLPAEHPGTIQLRVQRTIVQFFSDHLTDADDALRRLRAPVEEIGHPPTSAAYGLAQLIQRVRTNHFADATALEETLVQTLRPLGVEAGYGYALMALSHHRMAAHAAPDLQPAHREKSSQWWSRATLLLPPAVLVQRFGELRDLTA